MGIWEITLTIIGLILAVSTFKWVYGPLCKEGPKMLKTIGRRRLYRKLRSHHEKIDFLRKFRKKICVSFDAWEFLFIPEIKIYTEKRFAADTDGFFHPWHYINGKEISKIKTALENKKSKTMTIGNAILFRKMLVRGRMKKIPNRINSIPLLRSSVSGKTLILDSNRTLGAIFRDDNLAKKKLKFVVIEMKNPWLIVPDFEIVERGR